MKRILLALASIAIAFPTLAQRGTPPTGISAAMVKMFGDIKAFTAHAESRVLDKDQKEVASIPMTFSLRGEKLRAEWDLAQVKSTSIPQDAAGMFKQAGLDKWVILADSTNKSGVILFPTAQAITDL